MAVLGLVGEDIQAPLELQKKSDVVMRRSKLGAALRHAGALSGSCIQFVCVSAFVL